MGEGNVILREIVRELSEKGRKAVVLNLGEVLYVDSSGVGELVKAHTTIRNQGGQLKLTNLTKRVNDLLEMTHLSAVSIFIRTRPARSSHLEAHKQRFSASMDILRGEASDRS